MIKIELPEFILFEDEAIRNAKAVVTFYKRHFGRPIQIGVPIGSDDFRTVIKTASAISSDRNSNFGSINSLGGPTIVISDKTDFSFEPLKNGLLKATIGKYSFVGNSL